MFAFAWHYNNLKQAKFASEPKRKVGGRVQL